MVDRLLMSISGNFVLALGIVMQIRSKNDCPAGRRLRTGSRCGHTQVLRFSKNRQRRHTLLDCCRHWTCLRGRTHRRTRRNRSVGDSGRTIRQINREGCRSLGRLRTSRHGGHSRTSSCPSLIESAITAIQTSEENNDQLTDERSPAHNRQ